MGVFVGLFITPIISRLYAPEAYGNFSLVNSLVINFSLLATLNYTNAYFLPSKREKFIHVFHLTFFLSVFFTVLSWLIFMVFLDEINQFFELRESSTMMLLVPLGISVTTLNTLLKNWNLREKKVRQMSIGQTVYSVSGKTITLLLGVFYKAPSIGVIIGDFIGKTLFIGINLLKKTCYDITKSFSEVSFSSMKKVALEYKSIPLFSLPSVYVQNTQNLLIIWLISIQYDNYYLGQYSMASSLLFMPISVFVNSLSMVAFEKIAHLKRTDEGLEVITKRISQLFHLLFIIAVLVFTILFFFGEELFALYLGNDWLVAGKLSIYLAAYYLFYCISFPLSQVYKVFRKEKLNMIINICGVLLLSVCFVVHHVFSNFYVTIFAVGYTLFINQLVLIMGVFRILKINLYRYLIISLIFISVSMVYLLYKHM